MSARRVVVTGAAGGIGAALVARFRAGGDHVLTPGRAELDVSDESSVEGFFADAGPVDVLVNNAGVSHSSPLARTSTVDWARQLEVNATGAFRCTRAVLPGMLERGDGRIVFVASTAGLAGTRYTAGYTASKHAAIGLMRAVAAEVAGTGVTSNAVCPTFVRTPMTERSAARIASATGLSSVEAVEALAAASPLGRLLEPDEVAFAVWFLASPEARSMNGQALVLDGGGVQR